MDQYQDTRRHAARSWSHVALPLMALALAAPAMAAPHFVTFINDSDRTVTSIEAAPAGTRHWHTLDIGGPLIGGDSGEVAVRFDSSDPCKEDLSVIYRGMAPLTITGFDICRSDRLYLGKALSRAMRTSERNAPAIGSHPGR